MNWSSVIYLGAETETIEYGEPVISFTWNKRFVNKLSVRSKEFYDARQIGLSPELMFEIRSQEYDFEKRLKFDNVVYDIIRTYDKGEFTELICSRKTA